MVYRIYDTQIYCRCSCMYVSDVSVAAVTGAVVADAAAAMHRVGCPVSVACSCITHCATAALRFYVLVLPPLQLLLLCCCCAAAASVAALVVALAAAALRWGHGIAFAPCCMLCQCASCIMFGEGCDHACSCQTLCLSVLFSSFCTACQHLDV